MFWKFICAAAILSISLGFAMAEELKGRITKVDGNKITLQTGKDAADAKTLEVSKDVKLFKMDGKDKVKVDGSLADQKIGEKGRGATVVTDGKIVTEIIFAGKKKKE